MLEFLAAKGEVAIAGRDRNQRLWDLADQVYPADVEALDPADAERERERRTLRASASPGRRWSAPPVSRRPSLGWRGSGGCSPSCSTSASPVERPCCRRSTGSSATGSGSPNCSSSSTSWRCSSPLRTGSGATALPVLHDDRCVAKLDAKVNRTRTQLRINAVHLEPGVTGDVIEAIDDEVDGSRRGWGSTSIDEGRARPRERSIETEPGQLEARVDTVRRQIGYRREPVEDRPQEQVGDEPSSIAAGSTCAPSLASPAWNPSTITAAIASTESGSALPSTINRPASNWPRSDPIAPMLA